MKENMKNNKKIFLTLTLLVLLLGVTAAAATNNNTASSTDTVGDTPTSTADNPVVTEEVKTSTDNKLSDTKNMVKEGKEIKKDSVTINGIECTNVIENQEIEDYISLNENTFINNCYFTNPDEYLDNYAVSIINNSIIEDIIWNDNILYIYNSTINGQLHSSNYVYIDENTVIGSRFDFMDFSGEIETENPALQTKLIELGIYVGESEIKNTIINKDITNVGTLRISNCTINATINTDKATLIIDDDCILAENAYIINNFDGTVVYNNFDNIVTHLSVLNGTYTISNKKFDFFLGMRGDVTLINCTADTLSNGGLLTLKNSTIRVLNNWKIAYIDDSTTVEHFNGDGRIIYGEKPENCNPPEFYGENTIENSTFNIPSENYGNLTLINCNITEKITNNANIKFINCSLSNNDMIITTSTTDGILLNNKGNISLIECNIENNTVNFEGTTNSNIPYNIIFNNKNANLILNNSQFKNNKIINNKNDNTLIYNLGIINEVNNCSFIDNNILFYIDTGYQNYDNPDEFTLNITDSLFKNNTCKVFEAGSMSIRNSNFTNNKYIFLESGTPGGGEEPSGIAITATNLNVDNCTFDANGIISKHEYTGSGGSGGAIHATNLVVNNSRFTNNVANTTSGWWETIGTGGAISVGTGEIYNSIFEDNMASKKGSDIYSTGNIIIENNTFTNSYTGNTASSLYSETYGVLNITIIDNIFNNCKSSSDTIVIEQEGLTIDVLIENNIYNNDSINDELILNIPENIYTDEPITITGTYTINNPEYYDEDILKQNKFQVYINDELVDTVNTLEFTITPTTRENMLITIQPSISQTRKSAVIQASTLNITLEPITATIEETTTLTAQITLIEGDENIEVNDGRVYFKVNGKILRDTTTGRIIYADVTENTATLDYLVPKTWNEDTEIEAVFTGNDDLPQKTSNSVNPTITAPETSQPEFSVADTTAVAGEEVTITVITKNLDNGKVVLKVNGKTVKADDGKLYAKVSADATTFTYTVPKTLKAGDYTIKAVYTSGATKLESVASLMIG